MQDFKTVILFIKPNTPQAAQMAQDIFQKLTPEGIECLECVSNCTPTLSKTCTADEIQSEKCVAIALGGDGTYLTAANHLHGKSVPLLGINAGRLGFLAEFDAITPALEGLFSGNLRTRKRPYFKATVMKNGKPQDSHTFLNDAVIQRHADAKMIHTSISICGKFMTRSRADGIIISTATGSTAYNLSAGGPIMHPATQALSIAPICPHTLSFRPVIVPPQDVDISVESDNAILSLDGRDGIELNTGDAILITQSGAELHQLECPANNFFDILRKKLSWEHNA